MALTLKPSQLIELLTRFMMARLTCLITGKPGIGKSDIGCLAAMKTGIKEADIIVSHPVMDDPTDVKGFPMRVGDAMDFYPIGDIAAVLSATRPTLWFIDDIGQATPSMQAAYMRPLLTRKIGNRSIPDCVAVIGATNRRSDKAGVSGILEPVKSRFVTIVELEADMQEWCAWATKPGSIISPLLVAFLRLHPDLLSAFTPTADMTNSPCPRTWKHAAEIETLGLSNEVETIALAGAVGEGAAMEYLAFRRLAASMVSIDAILVDPARAALPSKDKPSEGYVIATGLGYRANDKTISAIGTYANRLAVDGQGEFAALVIKDATRRHPAIANTADYAVLMSGPLGALISGQSVS